MLVEVLRAAAPIPASPLNPARLDQPLRLGKRCTRNGMPQGNPNTFSVFGRVRTKRIGIVSCAAIGLTRIMFPGRITGKKTPESETGEWWVKHNNKMWYGPAHETRGQPEAAPLLPPPPLPPPLLPLYGAAAAAFALARPRFERNPLRRRPERWPCGSARWQCSSTL